MRHQCDAFSVDGANVGVFENGDQVSFCRLLQRAHGIALPSATFDDLKRQKTKKEKKKKKKKKRRIRRKKEEEEEEEKAAKRSSRGKKTAKEGEEVKKW